MEHTLFFFESIENIICFFILYSFFTYFLLDKIEGLYFKNMKHISNILSNSLKIFKFQLY